MVVTVEMAKSEQIQDIFRGGVAGLIDGLDVEAMGKKNQG